MSNTFNPEIIVHNGEGLTLTARPSQSIFAGTNGDVDLELKFKDGDIDGNNEVKYKNAEIGRNEISDDVFLRTKTPMIVEPLDGSDEWEGYTKVKVEISDDIKAGSSLEIQVSTDNTFNRVDLQQTINIDNPEYQFDTSSLGASSRVFIKCNIILPNGVKLTSPAVSVTNSKFYFAKNKQDLIRVLNNQLYLPEIIDTRNVEDLDYFWVSLNETAKNTISRYFSKQDEIPRFNFPNITSMKYAFGYPDDGFMGTINTTIPDESDIGNYGALSFLKWIKTSKVTNMEGIFNKAKTLNFNYDLYETTIADWDTSKVEILRKAFNFTGFRVYSNYWYHIYHWDTSSVKDWSYAFSYSNLDYWSYSKIVNSSSRRASQIPGESIRNYSPHYGWDMRNAENVEGIFRNSLNCPFLFSKVITKITDYSSVHLCSTIEATSFSYTIKNGINMIANKTSPGVKYEKTFYRSSIGGNYYTLDIDLSRATNIRGAFFQTKITPDFATMDIRNVVDGSYAFMSMGDLHYGYSNAFKYYPYSSSHVFNLDKIENADYMFFGCYLSSGYRDQTMTVNMPNVRTTRYMFANNYTSVTSNTGYLVTYNFTWSLVEDCEGMFAYVSGQGVGNHPGEYMSRFNIDPDSDFIEGQMVGATMGQALNISESCFPSSVNLTNSFIESSGSPSGDKILKTSKYLYFPFYWWNGSPKFFRISLPDMSNLRNLKNMKAFVAGRPAELHSTGNIVVFRGKIPNTVEDLSFFAYSPGIHSTSVLSEATHIVNVLKNNTTYPNLKDVSFLFGYTSVNESSLVEILNKTVKLEKMAFLMYNNELTENSSQLTSIGYNSLTIDTTLLKDISGLFYNRYLLSFDLSKLNFPNVEYFDGGLAGMFVPRYQQPFTNLSSFSLPKLKSVRYFYMNNRNWQGYLDTSFLSSSPLEDMECFAYCCDYVVTYLSTINTSKVRSMKRSFLNTLTFNNYSAFSNDINNWDVSSLVDATEAFYNSNIDQPLNNWNTSALEITDRMFGRASMFNQDISMWNVENVNSSVEMFTGCPIQESYKPRKSNGQVLG